MIRFIVVLSLILVVLACGRLKGEPGQRGATGASGSDGQSCTVSNIQVGDAVAPYGGALVTCSETSVLIVNGAPGATGSNGLPGADAPASAYTISSVIDPCGDAPGIYDEVFLKFANGTLVASFSDNANGNNTRLSVLVPGSYVTTDGSNCHFRVNAQNEVVYE